MSLPKSGKERLRTEVIALWDEYRAMVVFLDQMNHDVEQSAQAERRRILVASKKELQSLLPELQTRVGDLRTSSGARLPSGDYKKALARIEVKPGLGLIIPAFWLGRAFGFYAQVFDGKRGGGRLPMHAGVELDHLGRYPPRQSLEIHLPEAALYEDMCFHFNHAAKLHDQIVPGFSAKATIKAEATYNRAAVSTAFYMVEAYCNGLAFDTLVRKDSQLTEAQTAKLSEYDSIRHRPRYQTLRDKLVMYPMIAIGAGSPPIDETNCQELSYVVDKAKALRDAVVHSSPVPQGSEYIAAKTKLFSELSFEETITVVDTCLTLIGHIARVVYQEEPFWLKPRGSDGRFGEECFT